MGCIERVMVVLMLMMVMLMMVSMFGARRGGTAEIQRGGIANWGPNTYGQHPVDGWGPDPYGRRRQRMAEIDMSRFPVEIRCGGRAIWGPDPYGRHRELFVVTRVDPGRACDVQVTIKGGRITCVIAAVTMCHRERSGENM